MDYLFLFNNLLLAARREPWVSSILSMDVTRFRNILVKFAVFLLFLVSLISVKPISETEVIIRVPEFVVLEDVNAKKLDDRAKILADYLAIRNSPLQYHAQDFIDAADTFKMDWKLVPAIAGVESTFGKHIPGGHGPYISYNAWGWGVYGDKSLGFKSWRDGIFTVAGGLKTRYIDRGLTEPLSMNRVYAASPTWGVKVNFFLNDLNKFIEKYPNNEIQVKTEFEFPSPVAGESAKLASR
jgi:hypothetical protein